MAQTDIPGTQGYAERANDLIRLFDSVAFDDVLAPILHVIPNEPCRILDIGAGTGRDAAGLAGLGHDVTAVEPVTIFRQFGEKTRPPRITWLNDSLPHLHRLSALGYHFDVILMTAVWFHLDEKERRIAMPIIADHLNIHGRLILSLRFGPKPEGRRIFHVDCEETIALATQLDLSLVYRVDNQPSALNTVDAEWSWLVFQRRGQRMRLR